MSNLEFLEEAEIHLPFSKLFEKKVEKPKSDVRREAQAKGLEYYGFGRYGRDNKITYLSHKGTLVPFHAPLDVKKSKDWKGKEKTEIDQTKNDKPSSTLTHKDEIRFADKTLKDHNKLAIQSLSDDEDKALGQLLGGKLDRANVTIRRELNVRNDKHQEALGSLDSVLDKFKTPIALTVYRPTGTTNYKKGQDYEFKGFVKGTIDPTKVDAHHLLAIDVPKGATGIYNDNGSKDFILPQGTRIKITSDPVAVNPPTEDKHGKPSDATLMFKAMLVDSPASKLKKGEKESPKSKNDSKKDKS
jgi:hypothetical protein